MAGQFGLATESTPGTGVTVTKFFAVENVRQEIVEEKLYRDDDIVAGRVLSTAPKLGRRVVRGRARMKLPNVGGAATLLKHVFGSVSTAGMNPYTHTYASGTVPTATIQAGVEDMGGTVRPFTHTGCVITDWQLSVDNRGWVILEITWVGMDYTTATALASASYAATSPFTFVEGALTADAAAVATLTSFTLRGAKNLRTERFTINNKRTSLQALREGKWAVTGTAVTDFEDLDMVNAIAAASQLAAVFTLDNGTDSLEITSNIVLDGDFPSLTTTGLEAQTLNFKALSDTSDAAAFTPVLINTEASAA